MKKTIKDLLVSRISRFTNDMSTIAENPKGDELGIRRTTITLKYSQDDEYGLPIELCIKIDPRRLKPGEDGHGADGTFTLRSFMTHEGLVSIISELVAVEMKMEIDGEGKDYEAIDIDEEEF
jgi:hypothetical protein